jgi:hypothetical protein
MFETSRKLFENALFQFYPIESGCAALYTFAPFGGACSLLGRIAEIVGARVPTSDADLAGLAAYYVDFYFDFVDVVNGTTLAPGEYVVPDPGMFHDAWKGLDQTDAARVDAAGKALVAALRESFASYTRPILITETHLAMAKHSVAQLEVGYRPIRDEATSPGGRSLAGPRRARRILRRRANTHRRNSA